MAIHFPVDLVEQSIGHSHMYKYACIFAIYNIQNTVLYIYIYMYMYSNESLSIYICFTYLNTYLHIYIYIYIYMYTHIYIRHRALVAQVECYSPPRGGLVP